MKVFVFTAICFFTIFCSARAEEFDRPVQSKFLTAECDAAPEDERGPFGIVYMDNGTQHDFLVMTGVDYETCKDLEARINELKRKHPFLLLRGTGKNEYGKNNVVWRWSSIRTADGKTCVSYITQDCE